MMGKLCELCEQCGQKNCGFVNRGMEDDCEKIQLYEQGYDDAVEKVYEYIKSIMMKGGKEWNE